MLRSAETSEYLVYAGLWWAYGCFIDLGKSYKGLPAVLYGLC